MLQGKKDIKVHTLDKVGSQAIYRMNHLQPPLNNKLIRQAAMYAVGQEDVLKAMIGDSNYYKTCAAVFGCGSPYASSAGEEMLVPSNPEKAKQLLKEAKYDGTPVVILHPTDSAVVTPESMVVAQSLRKGGFTVDLQAMDWQTLVTRRASQEPPAKGGWGIFCSYITLVDILDPVRNYSIAANGKQAWFGWPDVPKIEELRSKFMRVTSPDQIELKKLADEIQKLVVDEGVIVPLGEFQTASAYRVNLTDFLESPVNFFWNIKKSR